MKQTILKECVRIAREKNQQRDSDFRHFSFIIQRNKLVDWGTNVSRVPPMIHFGYPKTSGWHSEVNAYRKAKGILEDGSFEVINIRLNKLGELRLSKPCKCCHAFLKELGCSYVYFSTDVGFARLRL